MCRPGKILPSIKGHKVKFSKLPGQMSSLVLKMLVKAWASHLRVLGLSALDSWHLANTDLERDQDTDFFFFEI